MRKRYHGISCDHVAYQVMLQAANCSSSVLADSARQHHTSVSKGHGLVELSPLQKCHLTDLVVAVDNSAPGRVPVNNWLNVASQTIEPPRLSDNALQWQQQQQQQEGSQQVRHKT